VGPKLPALLVRIVNNTYLHGADTRVRTAVVVTAERVGKRKSTYFFVFTPPGGAENCRRTYFFSFFPPG
jgi:hypothetical protein